MAGKFQHWLLLSARPDTLGRVYDAALTFPLSLTVAQDVKQFLLLAERHPYTGFVLDLPPADRPRGFDLYHEVKVRHPASFVVFLTDLPAEDALKAFPAGPAGWLALAPPFPAEALPGLIKQVTPAVYFHPKEDAGPAAINGCRAAKTLAEVTQALGEKGGLAILHAAQPDAPLAVMVRQILKDVPSAKILLLFDQNKEETVRWAMRNHGWAVLSPPHGIAYLLDQWRAVTTPTAGSGAPDRLMVVDDEPALLDYIVDMLSEQGFEVDGFPSGKAAIEGMSRKEYHVALVDFQLGDMTGLNVAQEFRKHDEHVPVILMTAHASLDMAVMAIQADVYDYLIKPVKTEQLKRSIRKALMTRRLAVENEMLLADLQKANFELNRLNELKSRFLSIVTHDLRTPLTSIKGYAELLNMQKSIPPEKAGHFLQIIAKEADHLGALINDLMDFVSIENGKLRIEKVPVETEKLLSGLKNRMDIAAQNANVAFATEINVAEAPAIEADGRRLEQVLTNLISNAFKHTPAGGKVTLRATAKDGILEFQVEDTGEGIPANDLRRVFEQFYQVESHASKRDGLGLGLTIAREIVQAHGGEIGAYSDGPGRGAKFWFTLPAKKKE